MYTSIASSILGTLFAPALSMALLGAPITASSTVSVPPVNLATTTVGSLVQTILGHTQAGTSTVQAIAHDMRCLIPGRALSFGVHADDVTALQDFLSAHGHLHASSTGYFGALTLKAVEQFQAAEGVPATGFVGPLTLSAIARIGCGEGTSSPAAVSIKSISPSSGAAGTSVTLGGNGFTGDNTIHFGTALIMHASSSLAVFNCPMIPANANGKGCGKYAETLAFAVPSGIATGTYEVTVENANGTSSPVSFRVTDGTPSSTSPFVSYVSPDSGAVGATIVLHGSGFDADDVVMIGNGAIRHAAVGGNGTTLTFVLPDGVGPYCAPGMMCPLYLRLLTPGDYQVSVKDEASGETSNSVSFTVTSGSGAASSTLDVSGLDAPSTLPIGTQGIWTVHAAGSSDGSAATLHYSVVWGDEGNASAASIAKPAEATTQSSATFTHTYRTTGTYQPSFTVTNDAGQSATVSASVTVTPIY